MAGIQFIEKCNVNDIGLNFTHEIHVNELCFLDGRITKNRVGGFETTIFRKSTAGNSLLR